MLDNDNAVFHCRSQIFAILSNLFRRDRNEKQENNQLES